MCIKTLISAIILNLVLMVGSISDGFAQDMAYKLYPTENIYTVLKLNTRNGEVYQVQIGMNNSAVRKEVAINYTGLVSQNEERDGRFELMKTGNMYNFVMLDRISGDVWQLQWSTSAENRFIKPIKKSF